MPTYMHALAGSMCLCHPVSLITPLLSPVSRGKQANAGGLRAAVLSGRNTAFQSTKEVLQDCLNICTRSARHQGRIHYASQLLQRNMSPSETQSASCDEMLKKSTFKYSLCRSSKHRVGCGKQLFDALQMGGKQSKRS